jgi:ribosomal protein S27AE
MPKEKEVIIKGKEFRIVITKTITPKMLYYDSKGVLVFELNISMDTKGLTIKTHQGYNDLTVTHIKSGSSSRIVDLVSGSKASIIIGSNKLCPQCNTKLLIDIATLKSGSYYCPKCDYTESI